MIVLDVVADSIEEATSHVALSKDPEATTQLAM